MKSSIKGIVVLVSVLFLTGCGHEHTFSGATCVAPRTCTECGETEGLPLGHTWEEASCISPKTCKICGITEGDVVDHAWEEATCTSPKKCSVCGKTEGEKLDHNWMDATCETATTCSVCGTTEGEPLGHTWLEATLQSPKTCSVCEKTEGEPKSLDDYDFLVEASHTHAAVETDINACMFSLDSDNPYDVSWDYGDAWETYVDACDWSLVFDAEYYKATFPMLAMQYHNDDALLLRHFQTVGVHEGRQGSADFNVMAYFYNCSNDVYHALGSKGYAAYYIYYMMNYATECSVNTIAANNGKAVSTQAYNCYTALQVYELDAINKYRAEQNIAPLEMTSEMCAFANYRAYIQREAGYGRGHGHDWANANTPTIETICNKILNRHYNHYGENTVTSAYNCGRDYATKYRESEEHYNGLMNAKYHFIGVSNACATSKSGDVSQYDLFLN